MYCQKPDYLDIPGFTITRPIWKINLFGTHRKWSSDTCVKIINGWARARNRWIFMWNTLKIGPGEDNNGSNYVIVWKSLSESINWNSNKWLMESQRQVRPHLTDSLVFCVEGWGSISKKYYYIYFLYNVNYCRWAITEKEEKS